MSSTAAVSGAFGERPVLSEVRAALAVLSRTETSRLWALGEDEVAETMGALDSIRATIESQQVAVMAEARSRGLGAEDGLSQVDWAMRAAPGMSSQQAAQLDRVAAAGDDGRLSQVSTAVADLVLPLDRAAQIVRFHTEVRGLADPVELDEITGHLVTGSSGLHGMTSRQLAIAIRHASQLLRPARDLEREEETRRAHRALYRSGGPAGMSTYRVVLDPEGAAILDAAIDPLSRPQRDPDTNDPDPRSPAARRADALLEVIRRGVSAPGEAPTTAKAQVAVTVSLEALVDGVRGSGLTLGDELLTPGTVRRLACDADLVPMVLGTDSEVLDVGRRKRLFTPAMRLLLWRRDRGCTYPGCTVPAQWTDAHHLIHWADGGPTDVELAALLCGRHHTVVHARQLAGKLVDGRVVWDLMPGSYDALLAAWKSRKRT